MHKPHKPNKRAQTAQTPAQTGTIRAQTAPNDLDTLNALRAPLAAAYGPVIISQAADKQSPVVLMLPATIRYCELCNRLKPAAEMHTLSKCRECAGV